MGAFSNMDYELQNSEAAVSDAFTEDDASITVNEDCPDSSCYKVAHGANK